MLSRGARRERLSCCNRLVVSAQRVFKAAHPVTERAPDLGQTLRTKKHHRGHQQEQDFGRTLKTGEHPNECNAPSHDAGHTSNASCADNDLMRPRFLTAPYRWSSSGNQEIRRLVRERSAATKASRAELTEAIRLHCATPPGNAEQASHSDTRPS